MNKIIKSNKKISKKNDKISENVERNAPNVDVKKDNLDIINKEADKYSMNKSEIKSEKQKQNEVITGGLKEQKKFSNNFTRNIIIAVVVFLIGFVSIASVAISGNIGTTNVVISANETNTRIVQAKLAELGYFDGVIDGIYDQETIIAIKNFQRDNNINETGSMDKITATAIGVTDNTQANTDLYLLAKLIYSESRGEPYEGQVAVGAVVLNRVDDAGFPNTLQGVIYQPWAFTALHDGQFNLEPNSTAYQAAQDALNGWDPSYGCLYYYNPATATSSWIFSRQTIVTIGNHVFCI